MENLFGLDWQKMFGIDTPLLEIFIRGSAVYLSLFALLRFVLRREAGTVGLTDLLVLVLIADAAQNAMAADYTSVTDGLVLVATIIFWNYFLDWLGYHVPVVGRWVHPPAVTLVRDGKLNRRNMRKELISEEELLTQLRQQGVEQMEDVKRAVMEGDGRISVIPRNGGGQGAPQKKGI